MVQSTIKDVAERAGVSFKTVSRVLNGEAHVREETREKVHKAAEALGYKANRAARMLREGGNRPLILLLENPSRSYAESVQLGMLEWCSQHGRTVSVPRRKSTGFAPAQFENCRGAILVPPLSDDVALLTQLSERGVPVVRIAPEVTFDGIPSVGIDDREASYEMMRHLIALGHRNIATIGGPKGYGVSNKRQDGVRRALNEAGIVWDQRYHISGAFSYESGRDCAERLLELSPRPTAIFAANDDMAAGAIAAAYRRGLRVPDEISICGFDDVPIAQTISPQLTTIRQPLREMAKTACALLLDPNPDDDPQTVLLDHHLVIRHSTGAPNSA